MMSLISTPATIVSNAEPISFIDSVLALINEALEHTSIAVQFDSIGNYVAASDYYDMAILNFNEALNKLPINSPVWNEIMEVRSKYDDRLVSIASKKCSIIYLDLKSVEFLDTQEALRHHEVSKNSISSMVVSAVSGGSGSPNLSARPRRPSMSLVKFEDDSELMDVKSCSASYEQPPTAMARVPYWQMRAVVTSIETGGYLSPSIYAPKMLWLQSGSKFAGKY